MAKGRISLSTSEHLKDQIEEIGLWYIAHGLDVHDKKKGGISLSATVEQLVQEKLDEIKNSAQTER